MVDPALLDVCARYVLPPEIPAVLPEPYLPFVPPSWNGTLVVAEAQNLSRRNREYRQALLGMPAAERFARLRNPLDVGVQPWDDGTLKLAVEAALELPAAECAVSNAVPWSQVDERDNNVSPSEELIRRASSFWSEILALMAPRLVLACGSTARAVFEPLGSELPKCRVLFVGLPSPRATARLIPRHPVAEVLRHFPTLAATVSRHPEWLNAYRANRIAYACEVIRTVGRTKLAGPQETSGTPTESPLLSMSEIAARLEAAILRLNSDDAYLLRHDGGERSVSHRLAVYLEREFAGWNVDCEYNRDGAIPKRLHILPDVMGGEDSDARTVYPDIVVHRRGATGPNLLVIEVKKDGLDESFDLEKLEAYRSEFRYLAAVLVRIGPEGARIEKWI